MSGQDIKTPPLCPVCGGVPTITETPYGERAECCDLVGWCGWPLVNKYTRARRQEFHAIFDPLWQLGYMRRTEAYLAVAEMLEIPVERAHAIYMGYERLGDAIIAAKKLRFVCDALYIDGFQSEQKVFTDATGDVDAEIGRRIRTVRRASNMAQKRFAKMLGISLARIREYENGTSTVNPGMLWVIARTVGVPILYFFSGLWADDHGRKDNDFSERVIRAAYALTNMSNDRGIKESDFTDHVIRAAYKLINISDDNIRDQIFNLIKAFTKADKLCCRLSAQAKETSKTGSTEHEN